MMEGNKTCTGPRFPRILMNKVQDSCTGPRFPRIPMNKVQDSRAGPRFPRIPRFFGTFRLTKFQKISGFLGILGLCVPKKSRDSWDPWACAWILHFVHQDSWESWACAGFMKALCRIMFILEKMHFACVCWWWTSEFLQRVFIFWWNFWKWRTGFWFCILGCFLKQMIALEINLHILYSTNTGIYSGFCMCHNLKDEAENTYVTHPLPQVGPGGGPYMHIYIYVYIYNIFIYIYTHTYSL